jgi:hypothetical protein
MPVSRTHRAAKLVQASRAGSSFSPFSAILSGSLRFACDKRLNPYDTFLGHTISALAPEQVRYFYWSGAASVETTCMALA